MKQSDLGQRIVRSKWRPQGRYSDCRPVTMIARRVASRIVVTGAVCSSLIQMPYALADSTPYHVLSSQDLCNLIWPTSQAMPDPAKFGALCVRKGGVLERLARQMPAIYSNTFKLEPGSVVELPVGSARINPEDPLSDWVIPDCDVPHRIDCGTGP